MTDKECREKLKALESWEDKHYAFMANTDCELFPCHCGVDEKNFNCMFCYCPLYALGDKCGGNFRYTDEGIKDCGTCNIPHHRENYGRITGKLKELAELAKRHHTLK